MAWFDFTIVFARRFFGLFVGAAHQGFEGFFNDMI